MSFWKVREQSLAAINGTLKRERELVEECFTLIEKYIDRFHRYEKNDKAHERFASTCRDILIRNHHFAHGAYSLCLDGLILEASALMRSLIEGTQMMVYISEDPKRIEELLSDNPLKSGDLARKIKAKHPHNKELNKLWHRLKSQYNDESAHFVLKGNTKRPLILPYSENQLAYNMRPFYYTLSSIAYQAQVCINLIDPDDTTLVIDCNLCNVHFFNVFKTLDVGEEEELDLLRCITAFHNACLDHLSTYLQMLFILSHLRLSLNYLLH